MALVLHQRTQQHLERLRTTQPHALIICGPEGSGKTQLSYYIAHTILGLPQPLNNYPYFLLVTPDDKGTITVEAIRDTKRFTQLKVPKDLQRFILIESADSMSNEAQNALLKLLEEPPSNTTLCLAVGSQDNLLPTVRSRAQLLRLLPPSLDQTVQHFIALGYNHEEITKAYQLSGGAMGLMTMLLAAPDEQPLTTSLSVAKQLLSSTTFDRLCQVDTLAKNKSELPSLLDALMRIAHAGLVAAAQKNHQPHIKKWHHVLRAVLNAQRSLEFNASTKLLLTNLMLTM